MMGHNWKSINPRLVDINVTILPGRERYQCPEILFDPSLIGAESEGIHRLIYDSVSKCDIDLRTDFYKNIVLSGKIGLLERNRVGSYGFCFVLFCFFVFIFLFAFFSLKFPIRNYSLSRYFLWRYIPLAFSTVSC